MRFKRTKSKCSECPLRDRNRVWGEGSGEAKIVLIGEAPGNYEDINEKPFIGPAGRMLNWALGVSNIYRRQCWVTNILPCRPPNNNFQSPEAEEALELCRPGFEEELNFLNPKVVVTLGANPTHSLDLEGSITKLRGSVFKQEDFLVLPTYHPSYIHRMHGGTGKSNPITDKYCFVEDLRKAKKIAGDKWTYPEENFNIYPTVEDIKDSVGYCILTNKLVAIDLETTSLNPLYGEIVCIGLAHSESDGICIPFLKQGGSLYWNNGDIEEVRGLLTELFQSCKLIIQNSLYDIRYLKHFGFDVPMENIKHDTMLLHHAINPELPHGLSFITSLYGKTPYWKDTLLKREGSILELSDSELRSYNLKDCVVLHQVLNPMLKELNDMKTEKVYYDESLKLVEPIMSMIETGVKLSKSRMNKWANTKKEELKDVQGQLVSVGGLCDNFNLDSPDDLRLFLFGIVPNKISRAEKELEIRCRKIEAYRLGGKQKQANRMVEAEVHKRTIALVKLKTLTKPLYIPKNFGGRATKKTKKRAVNKQGLLTLQLHVQNRIAVLESLKKPHPKHRDELTQAYKFLDWLTLFYKHRELRKLVSTYSDLRVDPDGRIRSSFMIHGTATGRLASSGPNLQNLPKKDKEYRRAFVADNNKVLLSGDYSNLEVRVLAYVAGERKLIETIENGDNIHDLNTKILFEIDEEDPLWPLARRAAKIFFFGGISYGGGDREIYEKVIMECPSLALTFSQYKKAKEGYFAYFTSYTRWREELISKALATRTVSNAFDRVRTLMGTERDIQKEALNFPIQSTAAYIINQAMIRIHHRIKSLGSNIILQIHDQLVLECPVPELRTIRNIMREEMEKPVNINGKNIIFPVDLEVGQSWGELEAT